jgi:hypothetical protein
MSSGFCEMPDMTSSALAGAIMRSGEIRRPAFALSKEAGLSKAF